MQIYLRERQRVQKLRARSSPRTIRTAGEISHDISRENHHGVRLRINKKSDIDSQELFEAKRENLSFAESSGIPLLLSTLVVALQFSYSSFTTGSFAHLCFCPERAHASVWTHARTHATGAVTESSG